MAKEVRNQKGVVEDIENLMNANKKIKKRKSQTLAGNT